MLQGSKKRFWTPFTIEKITIATSLTPKSLISSFWSNHPNKFENLKTKQKRRSLELYTFELFMLKIVVDIRERTIEERLVFLFALERRRINTKRDRATWRRRHFVKTPVCIPWATTASLEPWLLKSGKEYSVFFRSRCLSISSGEKKKREKWRKRKSGVVTNKIFCHRSHSNHETGNCVSSGFFGAFTASSDRSIVWTSAGNVQVLSNGGSASSL